MMDSLEGNYGSVDVATHPSTLSCCLFNLGSSHQVLSKKLLVFIAPGPLVTLYLQMEKIPSVSPVLFCEKIPSVLPVLP